MWWPSFYNVAMHLFEWGLKIRGWLNKETRSWNQLRDQHLIQLNTLRKESEDKELVWMHCASLGEFEQGLPVLKMLRAHKGENVFLVVSFFSPSGYNQRKNTDYADAVIYMPVDTRKNARLTVERLQPDLFIGVKYEFWWNHLKALLSHKVEIVYISVKLKPGHYLLKKGAEAMRSVLSQMKVIFTQDEATSMALQAAGLSNVVTAGDTRVSAVLDRKAKVRQILNLETLKSGMGSVMVYGSIYLSDLPIIKAGFSNPLWKHIVVPHRVDKNSLEALTSAIGEKYHLWSQWDGRWEYNILIVDTIGWLFDIYHYADACYIGGGFERSVHNTLEPAVFGLPLAFGPKNTGFVETQYFLEKGIALEVLDGNDFVRFMAVAEDKRDKIRSFIDTYFNSHQEAMMRIESWFLK